MYHQAEPEISTVVAALVGAAIALMAALLLAELGVPMLLVWPIGIAVWGGFVGVVRAVSRSSRRSPRC